MLAVDLCDVYIPCRALSQSRSVRGHHPFLGASNKRAKIILLQIEGLKDQVWECNATREVTLREAMFTCTNFYPRNHLVFSVPLSLLPRSLGGQWRRSSFRWREWSVSHSVYRRGGCPSEWGLTSDQKVYVMLWRGQDHWQPSRWSRMNKEKRWGSVPTSTVGEVWYPINRAGWGGD